MLSLGEIDSKKRMRRDIGLGEWVYGYGQNAEKTGICMGLGKYGERDHFIESVIGVSGQPRIRRFLT